MRRSSTFVVHPFDSIKLRCGKHTNVGGLKPLGSNPDTQRKIEVSLTMEICLVWVDAN